LNATSAKKGIAFIALFRI